MQHDAIKAIHRHILKKLPKKAKIIRITTDLDIRIKFRNLQYWSISQPKSSYGPSSHWWVKTISIRTKENHQKSVRIYSFGKSRW